MINKRAFITGIAGPTLTAEEREFIRSALPWGFILFKRNIDNPKQVTKLVSDLRDAVGDADAPVLIDQEGGRVQRLSPPHWPLYPPGAMFSALYDLDSQLGLSRGLAQRAAHRGRSHRPRHHRRLPAAGRRAGCRRRRGDRGPCLRHRSGQGRRDRAIGGGWADPGRRAAGAEAHPRPRPGHRRQPSSASGGRCDRGRTGPDRFRRRSSCSRHCRWR